MAKPRKYSMQGCKRLRVTWQNDRSRLWLDLKTGGIEIDPPNQA